MITHWYFQRFLNLEKAGDGNWLMRKKNFGRNVSKTEKWEYERRQGWWAEIIWWRIGRTVTEEMNGRQKEMTLAKTWVKHVWQKETTPKSILYTIYKKHIIVSQAEGKDKLETSIYKQRSIQNTRKLWHEEMIIQRLACKYFRLKLFINIK